MKPTKRGGGWQAIWYTLRMANRVGWWRLWNAMSAKNACKTCALGMGGQKGGMRNEAGHWPEVCKKSFQAMVADMQAGLKPEFFAKYSLAQLRTLSPRELEWAGRLTAPLYAHQCEILERIVHDFAAVQRRCCHWSAGSIAIVVALGTLARQFHAAVRDPDANKISAVPEA